MTGNDEREKHEVKQRLAKGFEIKGLGNFLSIVVAYSTLGISISQQRYVTDLLAETRKIPVNQSLPQWIQTTSWEKLKKNQ